MTKKPQKILLLIVWLWWLLPLAATAQEATNPTGGCQAGEGNYCLNTPIGNRDHIDLNGNPMHEYISEWYNFLTGTAGIIATVMIMYGGLKWLNSRGNPTVVADAKEKITSAIIGLTLLFLSWTILNFISPDLLNINTAKLDVIQYEELAGSHGTPSAGVRRSSERSTALACSGGNKVISYDLTASTNPGVNFDSDTNALFEKYSNDKVDSDILRAIAAAESSGNTRAVSSAGACGLMQLMPKTASQLYDGSENSISCEKLKSDPELSVKLAAKYVSENKKDLELDDLFAGYNGGYRQDPYVDKETGQTKYPALSASRDCADAGVKAYKCCINPGGLKETQNYVQKTLGYYNYYQNQ